MRFHLTWPDVCGLRPEELLTLDGPARARRCRVRDQLRIALVDAWPAQPQPPLGLRGRAAEPWDAPQRERVRAEHASHEVFFDVLAHTLDDRHDRDEEHDRDRDAGERERALELLDTNRIERETDRFQNRHALFVAESFNRIEA